VQHIVRGFPPTPDAPLPWWAVNRIFEGNPVPPLPEGSVVTVGTFDGVHRGHQHLLGEVRRLADELECPAVVVTFDRHPATVVRPESAPRLLSSLADTCELLAKQKIDYVYVLRFDEERSLEEPDDFLREIIIGTWHARVAVEGENFHFGHRRHGDVSLLEEAAARYGFKVQQVPLLTDPETHAVISSGAVREALASSDVATAKRLLGRTYEIHGIVEQGDHRGRTIGFPTANVAVAGDIQLPADGVYAGWYQRPDGSTHRAAISIGRRPTFYAENGLLLVEAHLLDFDDDLYGESGRVRVETWLRGQTRFGSVDDLVAQLHRDVEATRRVTSG
jgi:riboflavin kinase/FMN adenylyltransferase